MNYKRQPFEEGWLDHYLSENTATQWRQEDTNHWTFDPFGTGNPFKMVHAEIFLGDDGSSYLVVRFGDPGEGGYYIHLIRVNFGYPKFRRLCDLVNLSGTTE